MQFAGRVLALTGLCLVLSAPSAAYEEGVGHSVTSPCFSPDGSKIVFASDHASEDGIYTIDIYRINVDGTGLTRLTDGLARYSNPVWSPDGSWIAYDKRDSEGAYVMLMDPNGSNQRALTGDKYGNFEPAWLPDSSGLVVATNRNRNCDLILVTVTGEEVRYIAASPRSESAASCSPDGIWVAYEVIDESAGKDADKIQINIWKRRLADITIPAAQLTSGQPGQWDEHPRYSPDGSKILFESDRADRSTPEIWTMNADGSNAAQVPIDPSGAFWASDPTWSPDGSRIAFVRSSTEGSSDVIISDIWSVKLDGTELTQVTHTIATPAFDPDEGTYTGPQTVTITCATPGATIRYTTDGTEPTESSTVYTEPVTVSQSLTLKAKAWKTDWFPSIVKRAEYVIE